MTDFLSRLRLHWHVVAVAFVTALPVMLDQLGVVDLRPILSRFLPDDYVSLIIGLLPFVLAFLRPMVHVAEQDEGTE